MRAIAQLPELTRLVDEIFFEYHFYFDGRYIGWTETHNDVDDALRSGREPRLSVAPFAALAVGDRVAFFVEDVGVVYANSGGSASET